MALAAHGKPSFSIISIHNWINTRFFKNISKTFRGSARFLHIPKWGAMKLQKLKRFNAMEVVNEKYFYSTYDFGAVGFNSICKSESGKDNRFIPRRYRPSPFRLVTARKTRWSGLRRRARCVSRHGRGRFGWSNNLRPRT